MKRAILIKRKGNGLRRFLLAALGFVVFSFASPELLRAASEAESQSQSKRTITINLASALPRNSEWGRALDKLAADWIRITGGEVTLNILHQYPGSEGDYLMKLRQDKIQAAIFTSDGLNAIAPEIMALSIPFLIQNDDELDAVLRETRPLLDARIEQEGYVTMALVKGGWLKLFSRSPIFTPDDLRRLKLGASPDAPEMMDAFRSMGFNMVTTAMTDTVQKLNSGMVDAIYQSPIYISALQMYQIIGHMSSVNLAPFMGSVLMSRKAWASIPARYQSQLLETIRQAGIQIEQSFQKNEEDAIANMRRNGLTVNTASPAQEQEWRRYIQSFLPDLIERNIFNKTMYERIQSILQNYRQGS